MSSVGEDGIYWVREDGYYWVKLHGEWLVAEWISEAEEEDSYWSYWIGRVEFAAQDVDQVGVRAESFYAD